MTADSRKVIASPTRKDYEPRRTRTVVLLHLSSSENRLANDANDRVKPSFANSESSVIGMKTAKRLPLVLIFLFSGLVLLLAALRPRQSAGSVRSERH